MNSVYGVVCGRHAGHHVLGSTGPVQNKPDDEHDQKDREDGTAHNPQKCELVHEFAFFRDDRSGLFAFRFLFGFRLGLTVGLSFRLVRIDAHRVRRGELPGTLRAVDQHPFHRLLIQT